MKPFFITTPIYYINATPHIGHAYTQFAADARARFERLRGRKVYFLTGTDENALKIARVAHEQNRDVKEFCDELAQQFADVWKALEISYDDYIRTTDERHTKSAQKAVQKLWDRGFLETGEYSGWYSVPDETFFRVEDTVERDGKHYVANPTEDQTRAPLEWIEEKTHFFKLNEFEEFLLDYYEKHPETLRPDSRRNETLSYIKNGLRKTSISREMDWGIPVPQGIPHADGHVIYVWFEALMNYFTAPGYLSEDPEKQKYFEEVWPPDLQLMSKDIFTRFHATLWPATLKALDLPLPKQLFAHGFWTVAGRKMSKRDPETIVEPLLFSQQIAEAAGAEPWVGVDALRYYSLREVTFGADGDFSRSGCLTRYNTDLANDFGNLVQRALSMLTQYFEGAVPQEDAELGLRAAAREATKSVEGSYEKLDYSVALNSVFAVISQANRLIEEQKPWAKMKAGQKGEVAALLRELLAVCQWCAITLHPVMPRSSQRLLELLNLPTDLKWSDADQFDQLLAPGHHCQAPKALFPRIKNLEESIQKISIIMQTNPEEINKEKKVEEAAPAAVEAVVEEEKIPTIEFGDFTKIDLRVGKVLEAERVPKADRLLRLQVDLGTEQRQILAGIAEQFEPESLVGKSVVVVANLAPRKLRGFESQGMILAASTPDGPPLGLVSVDEVVPPGSVVR